MHSEEDVAGTSTGVDVGGRIQQPVEEDEDEDDGFERVEVEEGYETEGKKTK